MQLKPPKEVIQQYWRGYMKALQDYAWWQNSTQYVGSGTYTLKRALELAENKRDAILKRNGYYEAKPK